RSVGVVVQGARAATGGRRARVAAASALGDRADHRAAHRGAAARIDARAVDRAPARRPRQARPDLPRPGRSRARGVRLVGQPRLRSTSRAASTTAGAYVFARSGARRLAGPETEIAARRSPAGPKIGALTEATPASRSPTLSAHPRRRVVATC